MKREVIHVDKSSKLPDDEQEQPTTKRAVYERLTTIRARLQQSQREVERIMDWLIAKNT